MAEDTYYSTAVPILEYLAEHSAEVVTVGEIADAIDAEPVNVVVELQRLLTAQFILGDLTRYQTPDPRPWPLVGPVLGERGARAAGVWPQEELYTVLLVLIEQREVTESDSETKTRLAKLRESLATLGSGVATNLLSAFIQGHV